MSTVDVGSGCRPPQNVQTFRGAPTCPPGRLPFFSRNCTPRPRSVIAAPRTRSVELRPHERVSASRWPSQSGRWRRGRFARQCDCGCDDNAAASHASAIRRDGSNEMPSSHCYFCHASLPNLQERCGSRTEELGTWMSAVYVDRGCRPCMSTFFPNLEKNVCLGPTTTSVRI